MLLPARHARSINPYVCKEESPLMQATYDSLIATAAQPQTAHMQLIQQLNSTTQLHQTILAHVS